MSRGNLGEKLFELIQGDQGCAFLSDVCDTWPDETVLLKAQEIIDLNKIVNSKIEKFIAANKGRKP